VVPWLSRCACRYDEVGSTKLGGEARHASVLQHPLEVPSCYNPISIEIIIMRAHSNCSSPGAPHCTQYFLPSQSWLETTNCRQKTRQCRQKSRKTVSHNSALISHRAHQSDEREEAQTQIYPPITQISLANLRRSARSLRHRIRRTEAMYDRKQLASCG
jgi:hypothetical protein